MDYPLGNHPHTLAQFARRAGISEGRARALYGKDPSGLPKPDRADAGGKPLWFGPTIDAWCARTGRELPQGSLWLFGAPPATEPAVELTRRVVTVDSAYTQRKMFAIVWDTDHGHVIYLQPLDGAGGDHKDWMAAGAAELIEPRWWSTAVVIMPMESDLAGHRGFSPIAYVYRLSSSVPDDGNDETGGGLRRWLRRSPASAPVTAAAARAEWQTHLELGEIAAVLGRPIPFWLRDTITEANVERSLAYTATFTAADTVTEWPPTQDLLQRAVDAKFAEQYPAAFAALAANAAEGLAMVRAAHDDTPDTGPGWYLVARPARPAPPVELEQLLAKATPVTDLGLVAAELTELRALEGDLDIDDPLGDLYHEATVVLARQLRTAERGHPGAYTELAENALAVYSAPWDGPVVDAWRKNLTPVDLGTACRLRRVRRLLEGGYQERATGAFRDRDGRYVIPVQLANGTSWIRAEWPTALDIVATWTDETILAGDESGSSTVLLALTSTPDGHLRTDPVPLAPQTGHEGFGYGYGGGGPASTYLALLRCALNAGFDEAARISGTDRGPDGELLSQLWEAISTTKGPLRLSWPQVQLWARADRKRAGNVAP